MEKACANCGAAVSRRAQSGNRGPDIAWMVHCKECSAVVEGQMTLIDSRPSGSAVEFWQCRSCGSVRACRPGWRTRCPVCLDERTVVDADTVGDMQALLRSRGFRAELAETFDIESRAVTPKHALMAQSVLYLMNHEDSHARPGWTVLATDVWGMPWGYRDPARSHGTWAAHDACGTVQTITKARPECRACPPEADSRTHRAKTGQPQYLYLVHYEGLLKFGHGDANRVRAHLRSGCELVTVLRGPFEDVVMAELAIKRAYRERLVDPQSWTMPVTFGAGSEVVTNDVVIALSHYLSGPKVVDVTSRFA